MPHHITGQHLYETFVDLLPYFKTGLPYTNANEHEGWTFSNEVVGQAITGRVIVTCKNRKALIDFCDIAERKKHIVLDTPMPDCVFVTPKR